MPVARRHTTHPLAGSSTCAGLRRSPALDNPPGWNAPPAPSTSWPPGLRSRRRALVAARFLEAVPLMPADATPNSHCDQTVGPVPPTRSRNVAPTPPAAILLLKHSPVPTSAANDPVPGLRLRSSPRSQLLLCLGPVVAGRPPACNRQSPDSGGIGRLQRPPQSVSVGPRWRAKLTVVSAARDAAPANVPWTARVDETPVAWWRHLLCPKSPLGLRGWEGKCICNQLGINEISLKLGLRGWERKCACNQLGINGIGLKLELHRFQQDFPHNPNKICPLNSELLLRQVPGKSV
jgi:hypothetical protein